MADYTTVFLSSTTKDLQPWREAVHAAIAKLDRVRCVRMEDFTALDAAPLEACRRKVGECDVFVGLVGHFFGSRPDGTDLSCTQVEYEEAARLGKPRLMFLADDDFPLPPRLGREPQDLYERQQEFRAKVARERTIRTFHDPDPLATLVATSLANLLQEMAKNERARGRRKRSPASGAPSVAASSGSAVAYGTGSLAAASGGIVVAGNATIIGQQVVQGASPQGPDESALRRVYLGRLIGKLENLILSGVDPAVKDGQNDPRMKLRAIYTALRTGTLEGDSERLGKSNVPTRVATWRPLSALEMLDRERQLVLLGGPGSGKSTFVSFVALCHAGELLGNSEANLAVLQEAEAVLSEREEDEPRSSQGKGQRTKGSDRWHHGPLLPVRIVLRDFASRGELPPAGERATAKVLSDFLRRELEEDYALSDFYPILEQELHAGRCLVLFDGLDEVPEADERREQIVQAVQAWADGFRDCRLLVTSRTYAYRSQDWRLEGFADAELAPFDEAQIERFVGLWYGQMVTLGRCAKEEAENRARQLREAILGNDRLLALARQPLLLTLTASLHAWRRGELPKRREGLYRESVELLLESWERRLRMDSRGRPLEPQPSLAEWLRTGPEEVRRALNELAFEAHAAQEDREGTADLEGSRVTERLFRLNRNPDFKPAQLLAYLRDRAGLLVELGNDRFTFPHRTFQEYLAACHLKQAFQPADIADLARSDPGRWREVLLLAAGDASAAASWVWDLAEDLCPLEKEGSPIEEEDRWGALFSAQVVVESADRGWLEADVQGFGRGEGVGRAHRKRAARLGEWLDHLRWRAVDVLRTETFPVRDRAFAGKLLADLGDPRFDADHWFLPKEPDFGFLKVPAGTFLMGSDPKVDPESYNDEQPQHEVELPDFWLGRFPVTVGQFGAFVADASHEMAGEEWRQAPANHPVADVPWNDALAYCRWLGGRLKKAAGDRRGAEGGDPELWSSLTDGSLQVTIPSEAEWEKAARGMDGRIYPWAGEANQNCANYIEAGLGKTSAVGCFWGGRGPFGHEELSGNVWEWTRSLWGENPVSPRFGYPYDACDGREDVAASSQVLRVLRGGAFFVSSGYVRCAFRRWFDPVGRAVGIGFRVVLSPFPL